MSDKSNSADPMADHLARLQTAGAIPMTVDEVLSGQTQGGVPRPAFLKDHEDDGTVQSIEPGARP
jgi:hypothetical protein